MRRFSSAMMIYAMNAPFMVYADTDVRSPPEHLEQVLENLDVLAGLPHVAAPGVEAVAADQEAVGQRVDRVGQPLGDLAGQGGDVLRVLEDRHPLAMFVGADAGKALEHLVAFDPEAAGRGVQVGQHGAPNRMRVQHGADAGLPAEHEMQRRLGRRLFVGGRDGPAGLIDDDEIGRLEAALVLAAGGEQQAERGGVEDDAVVAAGAARPAFLPEQRGHVAQRLDAGLHRGGRRVVNGNPIGHETPQKRTKYKVQGTKGKWNPVGATRPRL